MDKEVCK
jgi:hypothetical protein